MLASLLTITESDSGNKKQYARQGQVVEQNYAAPSRFPLKDVATSLLFFVLRWNVWTM